MRKMMLFLMCMGLVSMAQALQITNGDFEADAGSSSVDDVTDWYDLNTGNFWESAWQSDNSAITPNGTQIVVLSAYGSDELDPLAGDSYLYQSIGTSVGESSLDLAFDWGHPDDVGAGRIDGVTVSVFASDGTFVAADGTDIYGATGVTLLDSATYSHEALGTDGEIWGEAVTLDISGASAGDEIFLRFNSSSEWPVIDNVKILTIENISPADGATLISPVRTDADNDLVFDIIKSTIVNAEVYFSADDPNVPDLIKTLTSVGTGQQTVTLETELASDLAFETTYYWKVVGYEPNVVDPNIIDTAVSGPLWSFTTAPEAPVVSVDPPAYTAVDAGEPNLVLAANGINGTFQWYKDGNPIADTAGVYAGTTTNTLTIYDVQLADEGYYTMKVENAPLEDESAPARVMIHRQTSYYDFESTSVVDGNDVFVDSIDGYPAVLMQESASAGLPTATDANQIDGPATFPGTKGLLLDNPYDDGDPNGQYLQIYPGVVDYEDITVALWIMPKSVQTTWSQVYNFGDADGSGPSLFLNVDYGASDSSQGYNAYFDINGQQTIADLDATNWVNPGAWHYIAITIDGNTGKIYVDGVWCATNTGVTSDPIDLDAVLNYIGKSAWSGDPEWNGLVDELKIWNYSLTNEEVAQAYMAYTGDAYICDAENNDLGNYDDVANGGNGNCKIDLPDFAGMAARWLEADQFYPAP